jgi:hypothetical protein
MDAELLALLLAVKAQMECDAVEIDQAQGWCRSLERMIDQEAMPVVWENLVAYLKAHGHE